MCKWIQTKKENAWLPVFMPLVWHTVLAVVFGAGVILGVGIALYTLSIRGLL